MTRRAVTPARVRRIMLHAAERQGTPIKCAICGEPIKPLETVTLEHMTPFALGGADDDGEDNVRPVHTPCGMRKTKGTAATGHRGDTSAIARAERLAKGGKTRRGPPIRSRGFDTRFKQKLNGRTVRREEV